MDLLSAVPSGAWLEGRAVPSRLLRSLTSEYIEYNIVNRADVELEAKHV